MIVVQKPSFLEALAQLNREMKHAPAVRTERWQGKDVSKDPSATSYELQNVEIEIPLNGIEDADYWAADTGANMPWADDHFLERVGGEPLNPGVEWANWPWASSAERFRDKSTRFNHTYMERLWPRFARMTVDGKLPRPMIGQERRYPDTEVGGRVGIGWRYGDLQSLVDLLSTEPHTRQAWIPLFFPEDTGLGDGGRKPCTLGYHFLVRNNQLNIWYPLRSCDLIRHFRDDCYLAVRLLLWVLNRCRQRAPEFWKGVSPGIYSMHCTSLHIFENDRRTLLGAAK